MRRVVSRELLCSSKESTSLFVGYPESDLTSVSAQSVMISRLLSSDWSVTPGAFLGTNPEATDLRMFPRRNSLRTQKLISRPVTNLFHILAVGPLARLLDQSVYCALNCLWRLSEYPDERTPHPPTISKTVLPGNFLRGEAPGLHHQSCGLHAQPLDCLRG